MITFDRLIELLVDTSQAPEQSFSIQHNAHQVAALITEYAEGTLTANQLIEILNLDVSKDTDLTDLKTALLAFQKIDVDRIENAILLAREEIAAVADGGITYDKALVRARMGLPAAPNTK